MRKLIELWSLAGAALIVPGNTGILITNQVGGTACLHPEIEGFIVPISDDLLIQDYKDSLQFQLCKLFDGVWDQLPDEILRKIQSLLNRYPETRGITIDWSKKSESFESWVWVIAKETEDSAYKGFGTLEGVLTWENSD